MFISVYVKIEKKKKGRKMAILQVFVEQVIKEDRLETFGQELKLQENFFFFFFRKTSSSALQVFLSDWIRPTPVGEDNLFKIS